jgi:hypothetical protein
MPDRGEKSDQIFSDAEAERRATAALRRALTTPYKPQRDMIGRVGRSPKRKTKTKSPAKR